MANEKHTLYITSFDGFSIALYDRATNTCGPVLVTDNMGHSKKMWNLLEYLLFSEKDKISTDELTEVLWPEDDLPKDPLGSLRLLVHRARTSLDSLGDYKGSDIILNGNETYSWNRHISQIVDTKQFESFYYSSLKGDPAERLKAMKAAISLYRGHFLPRTADEQWAMALGTYYQTKYTALCLHAIELLRVLARPKDIIDICIKAVAMDPQNEQLHIALIEALASIGHYKEAIAHYKSVTNMFLRDFGITPSEKMAEVYRTLAHNTHVLKSNITDIHNSMTVPPARGAFYCEYEIFRQIYNLKERECQRSGEMIQLALITAIPARGKHPGVHSRNNVMDRLGTVIRDSLRQGDSYTRYSVMQYLLLLQSTNCENGKLVLDRIRRNFRTSGSRSDYLLQCAILPLLPQDPSQSDLT